MSIKLKLQGETDICSVNGKEEFSAGETLQWTGFELGECRSKQFSLGKKLTAKIQTSSVNDFCPKAIVVQLGQVKHCKLIDQGQGEWWDSDDNDKIIFLEKGKYFDVNQQKCIAEE